MRILMFSVILLASACAGSKKTKNSPESFVPAATDVISLQRTGCYGTCPIYEVNIFGNGIVSYNGKGHTDFEGMHVGQLDEASVLGLFNEADLLPWNKYPDEYPIDNVDFPQFFIKYKTANIDKVIKGNTRAASELIALSQEIDRLVAEIQLNKQ